MSLSTSSYDAAAAFSSSYVVSPGCNMSHRDERSQTPRRSSRVPPRRGVSHVNLGASETAVHAARHLSTDPSLTGSRHGNNAQSRVPRYLPGPIRRSPRFTQAQNRYLYRRLPMRQPPTARTVLGHFQQLPSLYRELADGTRAAPDAMEDSEEARSARLAVLADSLARRYEALIVLLPMERIGGIIRRYRGEERTSKFWEKVFEEVERDNLYYTTSCVWTVLFIAQVMQMSALMEVKSASEDERVIVGTSVGLALLWAVIIALDVLSSEYSERMRDDRELHQIIARGLLRG